MESFEEMQQLTKGIKKLRKAELQALVLEIYGKHRPIDELIEARSLSDRPDELVDQITQRIGALRDETDFISWRESSDLCTRLEIILGDIERLLGVNPKCCFSLSEQFIASHADVLERSDSDGDIESVYGEAVLLWLRAAAAWQASDASCRRDWPAEVLRRFDQDNYGVWYHVIADSALLLDMQQLLRLREKLRAQLQSFESAQLGGGAEVHRQIEMKLAGVSKAMEHIDRAENKVTVSEEQAP